MSEERLDRLERRIERIEANIDLLINYMHVVGEELGVAAKLKAAEKRLESNGSERPTDPSPALIPDDYDE